MSLQSVPCVKRYLHMLHSDNYMHGECTNAHRYVRGSYTSTCSQRTKSSLSGEMRYTKYHSSVCTNAASIT
jgi:hypothetical protein